MNKDNLKLQLVISGIPGYFKLRSQHDDLFRMTALSLRNCLDYIENKLPGNVEIHGLFNAYTEEIMARRASGESIDVPFKTIFPKGLHADSGGLQMITLGKGSVEKEDRLKIYETQSEYAHYAMSFDEIPSIFKDDVRYYLKDTVKEKGLQSGDNLKEQFDFFKNKNSKCRILPIIQGWGTKDIDSFSKGLFSKLSKKDLDGLDIVASGFPDTSVYASAKKVFDIFQAENIPSQAKQHLHLLGVTGFKRLIPVLELYKSGFTPELNTLSFDSVTLSMSYVMGGTVPSVEDFLKKKPKIKLGKKRNKTVEEYWQRIYDFWREDPDNPFEDLDDMIEHSYYNSKGLTSGYQQYEHYLQKDSDGNYKEENKKIADKHFIKVLKQEQYYILYQVHNYIMILESFLEDKIKVSDIFKGKDITLFQALENVSNADEFSDWYDYLKQITGFKVNTTTAAELNGDDSNSTDCLF